MSKFEYEFIGSFGLVMLIVLVCAAIFMPSFFYFLGALFAYVLILKFGAYLGRIAYRKLEKQYD